MTNKDKVRMLLLLSGAALLLAFGASYIDKYGSSPSDIFGVGGSVAEFRDAYTVGYEGDFTPLTYSFKYNQNIFKVANLPNKSVIKIKDLKTGEISKIGIFYNGAAGFSGVQDFFENVPLGESGSDSYDVVNLNLRMFGRYPDGAYEGSEGNKVAIFKHDIGFVYVETRGLSDELSRVVESFDLAEGEQSSIIPTGIDLKVYYFNDSIYKNNNCTEVLPLTRMVFDTKNLAEASLRILLEGPTGLDADGGYVSSIPSGVWLNSVKIEDGVASVDFSKELSAIAGSCNVLAVKTQIEKTLLQFPTIKSVKISVEGKTEGILEP